VITGHERVASCCFSWRKITDLRRTSIQFSQHRTITSMERMSCSGLEFTREELSIGAVFFWQENHVCKWQEARKLRISASIIWSEGIFGAASIAVLHVHVFAGFFYLERIMPLCASTFICCCLAVYVHVLRFCWVHMERIVLFWGC
jgi:hypothetical protein